LKSAPGGLENRNKDRGKLVKINRTFAQFFVKAPFPGQEKKETGQMKTEPFGKRYQTNLETPGQRQLLSAGFSVVISAGSASWFTAGLALLALTVFSFISGPEHALAQERFTLTGASSNNFPPINFLNQENELDGFGRALAEAVVREAGGKLNSIHSPFWKDVTDWLDRGEADFIHDTGYTPERESQFDFTKPILSMNEVIFVQENRYDILSFNDLKGKTVACIENHITHHYLKRFPEIKCRTETTPLRGLYALVEGNVDAFVYPEEIVRFLAQKMRMSNRVKVEGEPLRTLHWAMTVKKGNREVLDLLNLGLERVRQSGEYQVIYERFFGRSLLAGYTRDEVLLVVGLSVMVSLLVGGLGIMTLFMRRLRASRSELKKSLHMIREVDAELKESEDRFRRLVETTPHGIFNVDINGLILYSNPAHHSIYGYGPGQLIGRGIDDLYPGINGEVRASDYFRSLMKGMQTQDSFECTVKTRAGKMVDIRTDWSYRYSPEGKINGLVCVVTNVTEENLAREATRRHRISLEIVQGLSSVGSWDWDITRGDLKWSKEVFRIFGLEPMSLNPTYEAFFQYVHPDDQNAVNSSIKEALKTGNPFRIEHRVMRADGDIRFVLAQGKLFVDSMGEPVRMLGALQDVTDIKHAEKELRKFNEQLEQRVEKRTEELNRERNFIATVLDTEEALVLVLDSQGKIVRFNRACEQLTGYSREEIMGHKVWDFLLPQEVIPNVMNVFSSLAAGDFPNQYENEWVTRDGGRRLIAWRNSAILDTTGKVRFVIATGLDITQTRAAEVELAEARSRLEYLVRNSPAVIYAASAEPGVGATYISSNVRDLLGYESDELLSDPDFLKKSIHPDDLGKVEQQYPEISTQGQVIYEYRIKRKDGTYVWVRDSLLLISDEEGSPREVVGVWLDVTGKVKAEQELARANEELLKQQKLAALGQLTATVSHELRNPLGTIKTSLFTVRERVRTGKVNELDKPLERMDRNIQRCDNIITDLLDYTRTRPPNLMETNLDDWMEELLEEQKFPPWIKVRHYSGTRGLTFSLDRDHLRRAVVNLCENSVQAMSQARKAIGQKNPDGEENSLNGKQGKNAWRLSIKTKKENGRLRISISDTGPGIPDDVLPKVFEPMFSTKNFGVGLGLPIVRQMMEQDGGGVEIHTSSGQGTTAEIWLPFNSEKDVA